MKTPEIVASLHKCEIQAVYFLHLYGIRAVHDLVSQKNRTVDLERLMAAHPDWDWDYWKAQVE